MTECYQKPIQISQLKRRKIEVEFKGGDITSDGGVLLLSQVDKNIGLTQSAAQCFNDPRNPTKITHSLLTMVRQRVYGIGLAYEDLNDHNTLRNDPAFQTAVGESAELASPSTLCRLEQYADRKTAIQLHQVLFDQFIKQHKQAPKELILDFDATDDLVHGDQIGKYYHGYYGNYCFLPLYVYCGKFPLASYLRPAFMDPAQHSWAILALLVKALRKEWPQVNIIFRADGGFSRHKIMSWCERHKVKYIIAIGGNTKILKQSEALINQAKRRNKKTNQAQRLFGHIQYAASTWKNKRRILIKAEHNDRGSNPRFVVTNLDGRSKYLYDHVYCARGDMENRIKEIQLDLFSDRTSCHDWWPNQLRLLFSTMAYVLMNCLRENYLQGTQWAKAQPGTIRLKLLKIGAVIIRNTRRIRFLLSSSYPYQSEFKALVARLNTS